ncbi:MAG: hypothetical protein ACP5GZ_04150 [Vulcanisaeta sp.]|jgi:hypothetical protein|uniref:Uncharacterized protein n=1 Tax=Vulcanisaeta moutnovskia (strain 768-28) TaxID=985053 RepID=F0QV63_VULM7|nr:hypothetical protein [Vulcanisaeta moutnovskia]ADY00795.1 hypothetical protein VMUT_0584 [Vulcanisaeta moutnovskia 768-28]
MPKKIIIVTAEWDYFKDRLSNLCSQLIKAGINCEIKDYRDPEAMRLIIKYGVSNGIVRIPQIYLINDYEVKQIKYYITNDLRLIMNELSNYS